MRVDFDPAKSHMLRSNRSAASASRKLRTLFELPYFSDQRSDLPEQFRAIGWVRDRLYSVIYEVRLDAEGEFLWLVTLWKSTDEERKLYAHHS